MFVALQNIIGYDCAAETGETVLACNVTMTGGVAPPAAIGGNCPAGTYLSAGNCVLLIADGVACGANNQCASGTCTGGGKCAPTPKAVAGGTCTNNAACASLNCKGGYCCGSLAGAACGACSASTGACSTCPPATGFALPSGSCLPKLKTASACSDNIQCLSNTCTANKCVAQLTAGTACTATGTSCASGLCAGGYCCKPLIAGVTGCSSCLKGKYKYKYKYKIYL